jgi:hypothetical protein
MPPISIEKFCYQFVQNNTLKPPHPANFPCATSILTLTPASISAAFASTRFKIFTLNMMIGQATEIPHDINKLAKSRRASITRMIVTNFCFLSCV